MACVDVCPVHAIYAEADLPPEFTKDIEFNATQAHQLKDSGAEAITARKEPLPPRRSERRRWAIERRSRAQRTFFSIPKDSAADTAAATAFSLCQFDPQVSQLARIDFGW